MEIDWKLARQSETAPGTVRLQRYFTLLMTKLYRATFQGHCCYQMPRYKSVRTGEKQALFFGRVGQYLYFS